MAIIPETTKSIVSATCVRRASESRTVTKPDDKMHPRGLLGMLLFAVGCGRDRTAAATARDEHSPTYMARAGLPERALGCYLIVQDSSHPGPAVDSSWLRGVVRVAVRPSFAGNAFLHARHYRVLDLVVRDDLGSRRYSYWAADSGSDSVRWIFSDGFSSRTFAMVPSADSSLVARMTIANEAKHDGMDAGRVVLRRADCGPLELH